MKTLISTLALAAAILAPAASASAATFQNGSFDDATKFAANQASGDDELSIGSTDLTGWVVQAKTISWLSPANPYGITASPSGGDYFLDLTGSSDGGYGGVSQTFSTESGGLYAVTFDLGSSASYGAPVQISYAAGDASGIAISKNSGDGFSNVWEAESFSFVATGATTTLSFLGGVPMGSSHEVGLDNVAVSEIAGPGSVSAAPEPGIWMLMLSSVGMIGAALRFARRRPQGAAFAR